MNLINNLIGRILALTISTVFMTACQASDPATTNSSGQPDYVAEALADAIEQTHFSAVARHLSTEHEDSETSDSGAVFLYQVEVREVFRGPPIESLTYELYTEAGETSSTPPDWLIITLCETENGYHWPGTGAIFPATEDLLHVARIAAQNVDPAQRSFEQCD